MLFLLMVLLGVPESRGVEFAVSQSGRSSCGVTSGSSYLRATLLPRLTTVEGDSVPINPGQTLFLEPNVPNPFSDQTIISYTLDRETRVTLRIFDAFYNEIATLVDDVFQVEGRYTVPFRHDGKLSSGMYFFSLTTSAGIETRRMLLVK